MDALKALLETQRVAALGTLHNGEPSVSMVPFALLTKGDGLVIHVSQLAAHTQDMLTNPAVSLLVATPPTPGELVHALPRASIQGLARQCPSDAAEYAEAKRVYLAHFPYSEEMFNFADFSLFTIAVRSVRYVGGFGKAVSITAERFAVIMGGEE